MNIKKLSDKELIDINRDTVISIYIDECYGMSDIRINNTTSKELKIRGYEHNNGSTWNKISK